jgi:hypothetical protein
MSAAAMGIHIEEVVLGAAQDQQTLVEKVAGAPLWHNSMELKSSRVAVEQSALFLTTPEASSLALACRDLSTFLDNVAAESGIWKICQLERGKFNQAFIWLHPIASLKDAARFAICAQNVSLAGGATFTDPSEVRSLAQVLEAEAAYAFRVDKPLDSFGKRFLVSWKFDLDRIADLLENRSLLQVVSDDVRFKSRYGISFALNLVVCKASLQDSELTFCFTVKMMGEYRSRIEIKVFGSVLAPNLQRSILKLEPVVGGTGLPRNCSMAVDEWDDNDLPSPDRLFSGECRHFSQLLSIVRVHMFPVSLCMRLGQESIMAG